MLVIYILILLISYSYVLCNSGTVLFFDNNLDGCWTKDDLSKLHARKFFEQLIFPGIPPSKVTNKYIRDSLRYYHSALKCVEEGVNDRCSTILKEALVDTFGSHLRSEVLPAVRFAFYAGYVPLRTVRQLHNFYDEVKRSLNTQGIGWSRPSGRIPWSNLTVGRIQIGAGKFSNPCVHLAIKRDTNSCIHLPNPKIDDSTDPCAISLPFKSNGVASLQTPSSENLLLKYYTTASRCILGRSPTECRHTDFANFNTEMWHWMKRDVAPHLMDEKLYSAYGGILRIAAAAQKYGKGLSRRNLCENVEPSDLLDKWQPWKKLTDNKFFVTQDLSPVIYLLIVILLVAVICMLQMLYGMIFGKSGCDCALGGDANRDRSMGISYANVDSNLPAVLPLSEKPGQSEKQSRSVSKQASPRRENTAMVYDMNENIEKVMPVSVRDRSTSDAEGSMSSKGSDSQNCFNDTVVDIQKSRAKRSKSPAEIDTSISQLQIHRSSTSERRTAMYTTTSNLSHSTRTYQHGAMSDTWTGSMSSTSDRSMTSTTSKSRSNRSRSRTTRDLAWARRVMSRHASNQTPVSTTRDSFTTPLTNRPF